MTTPVPRQLDTQFLLMAYRNGFFPMAESNTGPISWFSPDPRAILRLEKFEVSRSLRRKIRSGYFQIKLNTAFTEVIRACAERPETWISGEIVDAYTRLHLEGHAHSVESWHDGRLAGGLYGVAINGAFFGESMFARETDASKIALVFLVERMRERKFLLLDTQFINPHMERMGACEIPREEYLALLENALSSPATFLDPARP